MWRALGAVAVGVSLAAVICPTHLGVARAALMSVAAVTTGALIGQGWWSSGALPVLRQVGLVVVWVAAAVWVIVPVVRTPFLAEGHAVQYGIVCMVAVVVCPVRRPGRANPDHWDQVQEDVVLWTPPEGLRERVVDPIVERIVDLDHRHGGIVLIRAHSGMTASAVARWVADDQRVVDRFGGRSIGLDGTDSWILRYPADGYAELAEVTFVHHGDLAPRAHLTSLAAAAAARSRRGTILVVTGADGDWVTDLRVDGIAIEPDLDIHVDLAFSSTDVLPPLQGPDDPATAVSVDALGRIGRRLALALVAVGEGLALDDLPHVVPDADADVVELLVHTTVAHRTTWGVRATSWARRAVSDELDAGVVDADEGWNAARAAVVARFEALVVAGGGTGPNPDAARFGRRHVRTLLDSIEVLTVPAVDALAHALARAGDLGPPLAGAVAAIDWSRATDDHAAFHMLAPRREVRGPHAATVRRLEAAIRRLDRGGEMADRGTVELAMGRALLDHDLVRAMVHLDGAVEQYRAAANRTGLRLALGLRGAARSWVGENAGATTDLTEAHEFAVADDAPAIAFTALVLGTHLLPHDDAAAMRYLQAGLDSIDDDPRLHAAFVVHLGKRSLDRGDLDDAARRFDAVEISALETDDGELRVLAFGRARIASAHGDHTEAIALAREAFDGAARFDPPILILGAQLTLGRCLVASGEVGEARTILESALADADRRGMVPIHGEIADALATCEPG